MVGSRLFGIGGETASVVYIEEGLWVSVPDMPRAVYAAASVVLDGKLLVIGGRADVGSGVTFANVLEYDPKEGN